MANSRQSSVVHSSTRRARALHRPRSGCGRNQTQVASRAGWQSQQSEPLAGVLCRSGITVPLVPVDKDDTLWQKIREEAREASNNEPALASYLYATVLAHSTLEQSMAFLLANKMASPTLLATQVMELISDVYLNDFEVTKAFRRDLCAAFDKDPACSTYVQAMIHFKGFQAIQCHRVSHHLYMQGRRALALALQSRVSELFQVDIHPGAVLGEGILIDHATGVVIGETAVVGNGCTLLHHVTLGGSGKDTGKRHPTLGDGVLVGAGATLLGPINVGDGARIGAGSLVLTDIPAGRTAVGVPAKILGGEVSTAPAAEMMDQTGYINDYEGTYMI